MHILEILLIVRECSFYKCNISVNISNIQSQSQSHLMNKRMGYVFDHEDIECCV